MYNNLFLTQLPGDSQWNLAARRQVSKHPLQLTYAIKDEEELLHTIIDIADKDMGGTTDSFIHGLIDRLFVYISRLLFTVF